MREERVHFIPGKKRVFQGRMGSNVVSDGQLEVNHIDLKVDDTDNIDDVNANDIKLISILMIRRQCSVSISMTCRC